MVIISVVAIKLPWLVSEAGFEPARPDGHKILNLARLPFRHSDQYPLVPRE